MTVATVRPIPNLIGETRVGDSVTSLAPDNKRVSQFLLLGPTRIVKLSLCCDGGGGGAPTTQARLRGVIYQGGVLLGVGDEVIVTSGDTLKWVDLPMLFGAIGQPDWISVVSTSYPTGVMAVAGQVQIGVIVGGDPNVLRVAQIDPLPPGGSTNSDTYEDGPANPFGSATSLTATMSVFATVSNDWAPDAAVPEYLIAKYGFLDAQAFLGLVQLAPSPTYETTTMWHGTTVDDNRGCFAVVRAGGPLDGLVGSVIRVTSKTHRSRSVYVYVWAKLTTLDEDISIARRAFAAIELLAADTLDVHLDVAQPT